MTDPAAPAPDRVEDEPWDLTIVRVEVTVSAVIQEPSGSIFGKNMVDATLAFGWRIEPPREGTTDAQVNAALSKAISPVMALIQTNLALNGWVAMGQVDEPLLKAGATVVGVGRSVPVTVRLIEPDEESAIHD
jgi:hypothetical protein